METWHIARLLEDAQTLNRFQILTIPGGSRTAMTWERAGSSRLGSAPSSTTPCAGSTSAAA